MIDKEGVLVVQVEPLTDLVEFTRQERELCGCSDRASGHVKILFDASVLVAAMLEGHPHHGVALPWLQRVRNRRDVGMVATTSTRLLWE